MIHSSPYFIIAGLSFINGFIGVTLQREIMKKKLYSFPGSEEKIQRIYNIAMLIGSAIILSISYVNRASLTIGKAFSVWGAGGLSGFTAGWLVARHMGLFNRCLAKI